MNKKILLGSIFTISIIGMAHAETTDLNAIIGTVLGDDYTEDASTMTFSANYGNFGGITGHAQCGSRYCYCTLDGYTPVDAAVIVFLMNIYGLSKKYHHKWNALYMKGC